MKYKLIAKDGQMYATEQDLIKANSNCPETEKTGSGPGSCGGNIERLPEVKIFSDAKKTFTMKSGGITNSNGVTHPVIEMTISKPFVGKVRLTKASIMKSREGVVGFTSHHPSDVTKALGQKKDVFISLPKEALDYVNTEHDKKIAELVLEAAKIPVDEWTYSGEGTFVVSPMGVDTEFRSDLKETKKEIEKYWDVIRYELGEKSQMRSDDRGYRWYNVKASDIKTALEHAKTKVAAAEAKRNTPEAKAKRDAENARMSKIQQHWQDMEDMERSRE